MNLADELRGVKPLRPEKARRVLVVLCGLLADEAEIRKAQVRRKNLAYRKGLGADPKRKKDRRAYQIAWNAANQEKRRASRRRWLEKNREWSRKYQREWSREKRGKRAAA